MPVILHKSINSDTLLAVWKIEEQDSTLYSQLQLSEEEKKLLETLYHGRRRLHWLSSRVLLRTMLHTDRYIDLRADEHNKPYIANFPQHVSISHSQDYAAVMIGSERPVGVDIEQMKEKIERIAAKFLSEKELAFIDVHQSIKHLYACWSAKEALYKLYGKRGVDFKQHLLLEPFALRDGKIHARIEKEHYKQEFTVEFMLIDGYMMAWVV